MDLVDRQVLEQLRLLQDDADALAELLLASRGVVTEDGHLTRIALPVALEDLDRRRLARAVRTEQAVDLPFRDLEADAADGFVRAVRLSEIADDDRRCAHEGKSSTTAPAGGNAGSVPSPSAAAIRPQSG